MVGLIAEGSNGVVEKALQTRNDEDIEEALRFLETPAVKNDCLQALEEASNGVEDLVASWGRRESMTSEMSDLTSSTLDSDTAPSETATDMNLDTTARLSAEDVSYWNHQCIPMMSSLLQSCGVYSPADQDAQLRFLQEFVVPNLGPRPSSLKSQITSMATFSGFPLQPSINLSNTGSAKARYTFEPLDALSGTTADPFALGPARRMISTLSSHLGVWPGWIEAMVSAYHPSHEEVQRLQPNLREYITKVLTRTTGQEVFDLPEISRLWVCFIAFDLDGSSQSMKVYFDPKIKEATTGIPSCQYAFQVLRGLERFGNSRATDMMEQ